MEVPSGFTAYGIADGTWLCQDAKENGEKCSFNKRTTAAPVAPAAPAMALYKGQGNSDEGLDPGYVGRAECNKNSDCTMKKTCLRLGKKNGTLDYGPSSNNCNPTVAKCTVFGYCTDDAPAGWKLKDTEEAVTCETDNDCNKWWKTCVETIKTLDDKGAVMSSKEVLVPCNQEGTCKQRRCTFGVEDKQSKLTDSQIKAELTKILMERYGQTEDVANAFVAAVFNTLTSRQGLTQDGKYTNQYDTENGNWNVNRAVSTEDQAESQSGNSTTLSNQGPYYQRRR